MIGPCARSKPIGGWKATDCEGLYCAKCDKVMKYCLGDSKVVRRHMLKKHKKELETFESEAARKSILGRRLMDDFLQSTTMDFVDGRRLQL